MNYEEMWESKEWMKTNQYMTEMEKEILDIEEWGSDTSWDWDVLDIHIKAETWIIHMKKEPIEKFFNFPKGTREWIIPEYFVDEIEDRISDEDIAKAADAEAMRVKIKEAETAERIRKLDERMWNMDKQLSKMNKEINSILKKIEDGEKAEREKKREEEEKRIQHLAFEGWTLIRRHMSKQEFWNKFVKDNELMMLANHREWFDNIIIAAQELDAIGINWELQGWLIMKPYLSKAEYEWMLNHSGIFCDNPREGFKELKKTAARYKKYNEEYPDNPKKPNENFCVVD